MSLATISQKHNVQATKGRKVQFIEKGEVKIGVIVNSYLGRFLKVLVDGRERCIHATYGVIYLDV